MNDYFLRLPGARRRYDYNPHVHGVFVDKFVSENFWGVQNQWASCSFHPSLDCEHLAVLGDEDGNIGFADVRKVSKCNDYSVDDGDYLCPSWLVKNFKGHDAVVLDVNFLPADPSKFVTVSGDFTAKVWDVEANRNLFSLNGHDKSVRALACWQNDPNMFATGGRDGIICIWDIRQPPPKDQPAITKGPLNLIENAHLQTNIHADVGLRPRTPVRKGYVHASPLVPPNITSLVYADDHLLISGSSTIESGLGVWDLRTSCNQMMSKPVRVCKFPDSKLGRGKGVTSLCIDKSRFGLYAAATDGSVHEFVLSDLKWKYEETDEPPRMVVSRTSIRRNRITTCRREYTGFCKNTFYAKVVTSPITDHIMCSYGDELVRIWDTKETAKKISPSHSLPGHTGEVTSIAWSTSGKYILALDDEKPVLWNCRTNFTPKSENGSERYRALKYDKPVVGTNEFLLGRLRIAKSPPRTKRKQAFASPFKKGIKSPRAKMMKMSFPNGSSSAAPSSSNSARRALVFSPNKVNIPHEAASPKPVRTPARTPKRSLFDYFASPKR